VHEEKRKVRLVKKKFKGFPLFFTFKNFQTAFTGKLKQWASRRRRHCRRYRCVIVVA
jgi:hypothetical protein